MVYSGDSVLAPGRDSRCLIGVLPADVQTVVPDSPAREQNQAFRCTVRVLWRRFAQEACEVTLELSPEKRR